MISRTETRCVRDLSPPVVAAHQPGRLAYSTPASMTPARSKSLYCGTMNSVARARELWPYPETHSEPTWANVLRPDRPQFRLFDPVGDRVS